MVGVNLERIDFDLPSQLFLSEQTTPSLILSLFLSLHETLFLAVHCDIQMSSCDITDIKSVGPKEGKAQKDQNWFGLVRGFNGDGHKERQTYQDSLEVHLSWSDWGPYKGNKPNKTKANIDKITDTLGVL